MVSWGTRRFSQAISEGDGISVIVEARSPEAARAAEEQGAEALVVSGDFDGVRAATELPLLWRGDGPLDAAARSGADACLVRFGDDEEMEAAEDLYARALALALDCVVEVHTEEELAAALERIDPEIFLLSGEPENERHGGALTLLPDVPAGKLAIAEVAVSGREQVVELERAGVDAVIVGARDVAEIVGDAPPHV